MSEGVQKRDVRHDNSLTPMARLLYEDIESLSKKEGYCFATNAHFAEQFECDLRSIQRFIAELKNAGYIGFEGNGKARKIFLNHDKFVIVANDEPRQNCRSTMTNLSLNHDNSVTRRLKENIKSNIPPIIPHEPTVEIVPELNDIFSQWLKYKNERRQSYKPRGLEALIKRLNKESELKGADAVAEAIEYSMANNYAGIYYEKKTKSKSKWAFLEE